MAFRAFIYVFIIWPFLGNSCMNPTPPLTSARGKPSLMSDRLKSDQCGNFQRVPTGLFEVSLPHTQ